jgi:hypothetical protein
VRPSESKTACASSGVRLRQSGDILLCGPAEPAPGWSPYQMRASSHCWTTDKVAPRLNPRATNQLSLCSSDRKRSIVDQL